MLAKTAKQSPLGLSLVPSQYVIWPGHGLCVVGQYQRTTGAMEQTMVQFHTVKDLKTKLSKAIDKIGESDLRLPASLKELQAAIDVFKGNTKKDTGLWGRRAQQYADAIKSGDVLALAKTIHVILSKHKDSKWLEKTAAGILPEMKIDALSYSERGLAVNAIDILSGEIALVTGEDAARTKAMILSCALVPGHAKGITLSVKKEMPTHMAEEEFRRHFKMSPKDAYNSDSNVVVVGFPRVVEHVNFNPYATAPRQARFSGRALPAPAATKEEKQKPLKIADRRPKQEKRLSGISGDVRSLFDQEQAYCHEKGPMRALLLASAKNLGPQEFAVYAATALRLQQHRKSFADMAASLDLSVEDTIALRNRAAAQMKAVIHPSGKRAESKFFTPHEEKKRAEKPVKVRVLKDVKEPAPQPAPRKIRQARAKSETNPKLTGRPGPSDISEAMRPLHDRETLLVNDRGAGRGMFNMAVRLLIPDEFAVFSAHKLRRGEHILSLPAIAEDMKTDVAAVFELYKSAFLKVKGKQVSLETSAIGEGKLVRVQQREQALQAKIPEENRALYESEQTFVTVRGPMRTCIIQAAQQLDAKSFEIYAAAGLRGKANRLDIKDAAAKAGVPVSEAIQIFNAAAASMRASLAPSGVFARYPAFKPYSAEAKPGVTKVDAKRSALPDPMKPLYDAELPLIPAKGHVRAQFYKAAEVLTPEEFAVFSAAKLRKAERRMTIGDIAREMRVDAIQVGKLYAAASGKVLGVTDAAPAPVPVPAPAPAPYAEESKLVAQRGWYRGIFNRATKVLSPQELDVLSRAKLRSHHIQPLHEQAKEKGLPLGRLIGIHDGAVEKLVRVLEAEKSPLATSPALRKYAKPAERGLRNGH